MPNDCINSFTITDVTHDQWRDLAATFQVREVDEQQNFLNTYYPEPDYSITPVAKTYPEIDAYFAKSEEEREQILKNEPSIREDSWRDWRYQHWGTNWDAYYCCNNWENEVPSDVFCANFCTAWVPPNEECMAVISKRFPGSLLINYYAECGYDLCGVTVAKNGVAKDLCETISDYLEPFMRQQFPDLDARLEEEGLDLEDDLDEFFQDECDLGEFFDYIRAAQESAVEVMIQEIERSTTECLVSA